MNKGSDVKREGCAPEDLNGARGRIFHVDDLDKSFELLKETVIDPRTNEGRSRHTVYWTDASRFVKVTTQHSFAGIDKPVAARIRKLDAGNAKAAEEGRPFVAMQVMLLAGNETPADWGTDDHYLFGRFTADPASDKLRGGTIELDGRRVVVHLRGPMAEVEVRKAARAEDLGAGFWETALRGAWRNGRFVADRLEIFPLVDPRTIDDPSLPRVLVIGDSISMNYHEAAKAGLKGVANYYRVEGNGGPSDRGVVCMELWLGDYQQKGLHWDLIQFNHGLHDLKQVYDERTGHYGAYQVRLEDYKANLEKEIAILKKTGARLMWCSTTPVPNNSHGTWDNGTFGRRKDEDLVFNKAALEVISKHPEILVNDLNAMIRNSAAFDNWRKGTDVHFWGGAEQALVGKAVADAVSKALGNNGVVKKTGSFQSQGLPVKSHPNILYIHSHDTGRYIQPYGYAVPTPALQALAEKGVLFRQNFCVGPTCSPSRAALLTGCYPHENGMTGLTHRGWALNDYGQHILHTLRKAGYTSALAGTQHIARKRGGQEPWEIIGYDRYLGDEGCAGAISFLEQSPKQPFFLEVGFGETHRPFPPLDESPDDPRYCLPPAPLPDTPQTRQDMARFKASARILDRKMGQVLAALEQSGQASNTLVICTTDHGIAFPRMKSSLYDSGIGTMLMLRLPGVFDGGKVVDAMTSHLDLFPTVCELAGIDSPPWLRGRSLLPLASGDDGVLHEELFFELNYHAAYEPTRAVRTKRWKYIRHFDGRQKPVLANVDDSESKSVWREHGWADHTMPQEELYDLCFDPNEKQNLVGDTDSQPVLQEMRSRLERWMRETNDPLQQGPVPAPPGAKVNHASDLSPRWHPNKDGNP